MSALNKLCLRHWQACGWGACLLSEIEVTACYCFHIWTGQWVLFCFFKKRIVWKCWKRRTSVSFICSFSTRNDTSANARFMQDCMFCLLCKVSKKWRLIFVVILLAGGESDWNFRSKHLVQSEFLFQETYSRLHARCACSSCYHGGRRGFMRHACIPLWGCVQICAWCAGRAEISVRGFYYRKLWHSAFNPP